MANLVKYFIFVCLFVITLAIDDSELKLSDTKDCTNFCQFRFSTNDDVSTCARGCRFYAISHLLVASPPTAHTECLKSCNEAYSPSSPTSEAMRPCETGCGHQFSLTEHASQIGVMHDTAVNKGAVVDPATKDDVELLDSVSIAGDAPSANAADKPGPEEEINGMSLSFDRPVMQVRKVVAQVRGAFHILKTSVLTYFLQDDDTLLAVQSQPQVIVGVAPEDGFNSPEEVLQEAEDKPQSREDNTLPDGFGEMIRVSGFSDADGPLPPSSSGVEVVPLAGRRSAYLLHLLLLLAVVSLALLGLSYCLAAARHQQRRALKAANLQTAVQHQPLKLVRPEDLTKLSLMEEEDHSHQQAPPLPNKQDFALTHANV